MITNAEARELHHVRLTLMQLREQYRRCSESLEEPAITSFPESVEDLWGMKSCLTIQVNALQLREDELSKR